jgi:hypothetical protein
MKTESKQTSSRKDLKKKRDSPPRRSLREILQQRAGSSGAPLRGPAGTSEPAAVISAKGREEPIVKPPFSWELVGLTRHCREPIFLAYLQ